MPGSVRVREVMIAEPLTVPPDAAVRFVLGQMDARNIGAVLVTQPDGELLGIFTERDLLRQLADPPADWRDRPIAEWMTPAPHTIAPDADWEETVALMERLNVRHLPVVEVGRLVGLVTARDLIARRTGHLDRLIAERTRELIQTNELLTQRDAETRRNLDLAGRLQQGLLLPGSPPNWPEVTWGIHYAPCDPLGGDYYDFAQPDDERFGILIADASGHSLPAAIIAIMTRFAFTDVVRETTRPAEVLAELNRRLLGLTDERFVTAFYGVYERVSRRFTYANAGHPPPLHCSAARPTCRPLAARGFMLGVLPEAAYQENSVRLEPGDRLCFFTDGLIDAKNPAGDLYGQERLVRLLLESRPRPLRWLTQAVIDDLHDYRAGRPCADDVTLLLAEVGV